MLKPAKWHVPALRLWHAWLAGAFLVAYVTGDEDTYAMHFFAGYAVLAALAVRLALGLLAAPASPLRLPRPNLRPSRRNPLYAWLGAAVLATAALSAVTGAVADPIHWLEDLHEGLSEMALLPVVAHVAFILAVHGGRRLRAYFQETPSCARS